MWSSVQANCISAKISEVLAPLRYLLPNVPHNRGQTTNQQHSAGPKRDSSNWTPFDTSALGIHSRSRQGIVEIPSQSSSWYCPYKSVSRNRKTLVHAVCLINPAAVTNRDTTSADVQYIQTFQASKSCKTLQNQCLDPNEKLMQHVESNMFSTKSQPWRADHASSCPWAGTVILTSRTCGMKEQGLVIFDGSIRSISSWKIFVTCLGQLLLDQSDSIASSETDSSSFPASSLIGLAEIRN